MKKCIIIFLLCNMLSAKGNDLAKISYEDLTKLSYKYFKAMDYDKSKIFFYELLKRQLQNQDKTPKELGTIYFALGRIAVIQKDKNAPIFLAKAKEAFKDSNDYSLKANIELTSWDYYFHKKEFKKALIHAEKSELLARMIKTKLVFELSIFKIAVARSLQANKQYKQAITYYTQISKTLKDHDKNENAIKRIEQFRSECIKHLKP